MVINSATGKSGDAGRRDAILDIVADSNWLRGIDLRRADVRGLSFPPETNLEEALFDGQGSVIVVDSAIAPTFEQASGSWGHLEATRFFPLANFGQAQLIHTWLVGKMCLAYFGQADLSHATLAIDFRGVSFRGANLTGATFVLHPDSVESTLRGVDFRGANVAGLRISPTRVTQESYIDSALTKFALDHGAVAIEDTTAWKAHQRRQIERGEIRAARLMHTHLVEEQRFRWSRDSRKPERQARTTHICDVSRDSVRLNRWARRQRSRP